jgi:hypothetical protein
MEAKREGGIPVCHTGSRAGGSASPPRSRSRSGPLRFLGPLAGLVLALTLLAQPAAGQLGSSSRMVAESKPRVFLDCQSGMNCDFDHFRTEIPFVSWVRDRSDADVHVVFTSTDSGAGGRRYTMDFVGLQDLRGLQDALTYTSLGTDVRAEVVDGLTRTLELGLLRYAVQTGQGRYFQVGYTGTTSNNGGLGEDGDASRSQAPALYDPWNFWTFRFGGSGNMNVEERKSDWRFNPSAGADRVTESWKVNLSLWANLRRERIELSDGRVVRNDRDSWRTSALIVRSVTDRVSVGFDSGAGNSVQNNQRVRLSLAPAVEWNYFPYMEATRRQLIAHYAAGVEYSNYREETIYGVMDEMVPQHRVALQYRAREEWGNAGVGFETAQYLHDASLYSLGFNGDLNYRILRGLELSLSGSASLVNDQIYLPATSLSDEDILLGRASLPTGYDYQASVGINYRWGSSFANVVNNRFPRSVR